MNVRETAPADDPYVDPLVVQYVWDGNTLSFSFPTAAQYTGYSGGEPTINFAQLNAAQQAAIRAILAQVAGFANVTFSEITGTDAGTATLRFGLTGDTDPAHAYLPDSDELGGDAWFANDGTFNDVTKGSYGYFGMMHEVGHTLGLDHSHDPDQGVPMPADRDHVSYTVMSYRSYEGAPIGYTAGVFPRSFMMEDIAALQHIYGANFGHNAGNTTYQWNQATGEMSINGVGQGVPGGPLVFQTVWDGGGTDTYDFSNIASGIGWIDLRPGAWVYLNGWDRAHFTSGQAPGQVANSHLYNSDPRSLIENATGNAGNNFMYGNDADNSLEGRGGQDELHGYLGADHLSGGDGEDKLYGYDGDDLLEGGAEQDFLDGHGGNDSLFGGDGVDYLTGHDGNDTMDGGALPDSLIGGNGDDSLTGGSGNDQLYGDAGSDYLAGGLGDDIVYVDSAGDQVVELAGEGNDRVETWVSFAAPAAVEVIVLKGSEALSVTGNGLANSLYGNVAANTLDGSTGADSMEGGLGDDIYYVDDAGDLVAEAVNAGTDTVFSSVSFTLAPLASEAVERLILTGSAALNGTGSTVANLIRGNSGNNTLDGRDGNDTLYGGLGADELLGGGGADVFVYEVLSDSSAGQMDWLPDFQHGADLIDIRAFEITGFSFQLFGAPGEASYYSIATIGTISGTDLVLRIYGAAATDDFLFNEIVITGPSDTLFGTGGADQLDGGAGDDFLIGLEGSDRLIGGYGNDVFYVDAAGDEVIEAVGQGDDRVSASLSYFLRLDAAVELIEYSELASTAAVSLGGSDSANTIYGNNGANFLYGMGAGDTLWGFGGNDYLVGGTGADVLWGGTGDDTYYIDQIGDLIYELAGEGQDRVAPSIDYTLPDNAAVELVEAITLSATNALNLGGSSFANTLQGNNGQNILHGYGGNDALWGSGGDDYLVGGTGDDVMYGGGGNDTYYIDSTSDFVYELAGEGYDRVATDISFTLPDHAEIELLEAINLDGATAINLTGSELANTIGGNAGANVLHGYGGDDTLYGHNGNDYLLGDAGNDTMIGGIGGDTYYVDGVGDVIIELDYPIGHLGYMVGGDDRVVVTSSYKLPEGADIEILEPANITGSEPINLVGNDGHGQINGNDGDNVIDGRGGQDSITGNLGADTFQFTTALGGFNVDTLYFFEIGVDKIALDADVFTRFNPGGLDPATFHVGSAAQDENDFVIYNSATGAISYDADGNGAGAAVQFASLIPKPALAASDFMVI